MRSSWAFLLVFWVAGCGKNESTTSPTTGFGPPANLQALSVNKSTVRLQWGRPVGVTDSVLAGYVVQRGTRKDSVAKAVTTFDADSLSQGEAVFTVYSRNASGVLSDGSSIHWAPADRFDTPYVLFEHKLATPTVEAGLSVGTGSLTPATMALDASASTKMDVWLYGGNGPTAEPLELRSAGPYEAGWKTTLFSTVTNTSASLDYPLAVFPAPSTFTLDHVTVSDNVIYYVRASGDNGGIYFARLHVHIKSGSSFPARAVEIQISLQRVPGLQYACGTGGGSLRFAHPPHAG